MIPLIQTILIIFMLFKTFELTNLKVVYLTILISTSFFCILNPFYLSIVGVLNNQNLAFLILLIFSIPNLLTIDKDNNKIFWSLGIFIAICIVSYINTISQWPHIIESFKIFTYCGSFTIIFFLTAKFRDSDYSEIVKFYSLLELFTVINAILFILTTFKIDILYINKELFDNLNASSRFNVIRGSSGFPILNPLIFAVSYIRLRKKISLRQFSIFILSVLAVFFSYTRGEIIAYLGMIFSIEFILFKYLNSKILLTLSGLLLIFGSLLPIFLPAQVKALLYRFDEVTRASSLDDIANTAIRYAKFEERLNYVMNNNYLIGTGFINNYKTSVRLPFKYGPSYIDADQFYGNLLLVAGFLGSAVFLLFIFYCLKALKNKIIYSEFVPSIFAVIIYLLILGFYSNNIMYYSVIFSIIISLGISFGLSSTRQERYSYK